MQGPEPLTIWIETADGAIARGRCEVVSEEGAVVRLSSAGPLAAADSVAVRIAVSASDPILPATARVLWVRSEGDALECEVAWTHAGPERDQLTYLVTAAID